MKEIYSSHDATEPSQTTKREALSPSAGAKEDWVSSKISEPSSPKSPGSTETTELTSGQKKIEGETSFSKSDQPLKSRQYIDRMDLTNQEKLELTIKQIETSYKNLHEEVKLSEPFLVIDKIQELQNSLNSHYEQLREVTNIALDKILLPIKDHEFDTKIGATSKDLSDQIVELIGNTYLAIMQRNFEINKKDYYKLLIKDVDRSSSEHPKLADRLAALKETAIVENVIKADAEFNRLFQEEKNQCVEQAFKLIGTKPPAFISIDKLIENKVLLLLNRDLVEAYRELARAGQALSKALHTPEVNEEFKKLGETMPGKVKEQLNQRQQAGMTQALIERNYQFFYRSPTIEKLQQSELKSETFDPLMRWEVIEGDANNYYNAVTITTFPDNKFFHDDDPFNIKIALDPVAGTLVNHHDDDEADKKYREDKFPKDLSNETWPNYLKNDKKLKNEFWLTYIKETLDHLPEESSPEAWLHSIEKQLAIQKEPGLEYLKKLLDPKHDLPKVPAKNSLASIEELLEIKDDYWFDRTMDMLEIKDLPPQLSDQDWRKYTEGLSMLQKELPQEPSKTELLQYTQQL